MLQKAPVRENLVQSLHQSPWDSRQFPESLVRWLNSLEYHGWPASKHSQNLTMLASMDAVPLRYDDLPGDEQPELHREIVEDLQNNGFSVSDEGFLKRGDQLVFRQPIQMRDHWRAADEIRRQEQRDPSTLYAQIEENRRELNLGISDERTHTPPLSSFVSGGVRERARAEALQKGNK